MSMLDTDTMPGRIESWLGANVRPATVESYTIMTGGFSRVMARVDVSWSDGGSESFVLRGDPPPEIAALESDRDAEWALLSDLTMLGSVKMPAARWYVHDESHFGTKAIFIDFVDGGSLQATFDDGRDHAATVDPLVELMASVSSVEPGQVPSLPAPASWDDHMDAIIGRWRALADTHCESVPFVRHIAAWLKRRKPAPAPLRLAHGDFQQGNILDTAHGLQVIDWEFSRIGDPREDLGYYAAYSAAVPPNLIELDLDGFLQTFRDKTGLDEEQVNPLTHGYFTVLSTISSIEGLYTGLSAMHRGERRGVAVAYNSQLIPVGNDNFVTAIDTMEAALAAVEGA